MTPEELNQADYVAYLEGRMEILEQAFWHYRKFSGQWQIPDFETYLAEWYEPESWIYEAILSTANEVIDYETVGPRAA